MIVELLGLVVCIAGAWLFVYSAALFGAKPALRDHFADQPGGAPLSRNGSTDS